MPNDKQVKQSAPSGFGVLADFYAREDGLAMKTCTDEQAALKVARELVNEHEVQWGIISDCTGLSYKISALILRERKAAVEAAHREAHDAE